MQNISTTDLQDILNHKRIQLRVYIEGSDGTEIILVDSNDTLQYLAENLVDAECFASIIHATYRAQGYDSNNPLGQMYSASLEVVVAQTGIDAFGLKARATWAVNETEYPLIVGRVQERPKVKGGQTTITINDDLFNFESADYPEFTADSALIRTAFKAICDQIGLGSNTSNAFTKYINPKKLNALPARDALCDLGACCGGNVIMTRDGNVGICNFATRDQQITEVVPYSAGANADNESPYSATGITLGDYSAGDGSVYFDSVVATQEIANAAFNALQVASVKGSYSLPGCIVFEPGDVITVKSADGDYNIGIESIAIDYDGGIMSTVEGFGCEQTGIKGKLTKRFERVEADIAGKPGMYETRQAQSGGGYIYYLHDKPDLSASTIVMKLDTDGMSMSTDGGASYPYAFKVNGEVIASILSATGINADWITAGSILVKDTGGNTVLQASADDGTLIANKGSISGWYIGKTTRPILGAVDNGLSLLGAILSRSTGASVQFYGEHDPSAELAAELEAGGGVAALHLKVAGGSGAVRVTPTGAELSGAVALKGDTDITGDLYVERTGTIPRITFGKSGAGAAQLTVTTDGEMVLATGESADAISNRLRINATELRPNYNSAMDIGKTDKRFKDLYLSGSVYQGALPLLPVQSGTVTVTPTAADTATSFEVTFPTAFDTVPNVVLTPASVNVQAAIVSTSKTGFTGSLRRNTATNSKLTWLAVAT